MPSEFTLTTIARIYTDFPEKFGIPRQSGLVATRGKIVFEPEYRNPDAVRGLEGYSHLWLLWEFTEASGKPWRPTVRPPRLGGNRRVGVFATRSPFRPNSVGLSCVALERVVVEEEGPVLYVTGADLLDQTPIFDIKPYLPYADSHPEARGGFADDVRDYALKVDFPEQWLDMVPKEHRQIVTDLLAQDPRPSYQKDPDRVYGMAYNDMEIKFRVADGWLFVCGVSKRCTQDE